MGTEGTIAVNVLKRFSIRMSGEPMFAFAAMLIVNAAYLAYKGVFIAPDSSFYIKGADRLVAAGFDFQQFLSSNPRYGQYIGFVTWCGLLKSLFGEAWPQAVVCANALANALTVGVLTFHLKRVGISWPARAGIIAWSLIAFDLLVWSKGLLSDPTFLILATAAVTAWASRATMPARSLILPAALMIAAIFWRPTGIALLMPLAACGLLRFSPRLPQLKRVYLILAAALAVEVTFLVFAWFMANPELWPLPVGGSHISYTANYYDQGQVVWKRFGTYHDAPQTLLDYHLITLDRLRYWFACYESEFSLAHKAYNIVFYVPLFAGSALSALFWGRGRFRRSEDLDRLVAVLLTTVLAFTAMHAMLQVDYGWRYRVPIIPCLLMLTAIAVDEIVRCKQQKAATRYEAPSS